MADLQTELLIELIAKADKFIDGMDQAIEKMNTAQKSSEKTGSGISLNFLAAAAAIGFTVKALMRYTSECIEAAGKEAALSAAFDQVITNLGLNKDALHENIEAIAKLGYDHGEAMTLVMRFIRAELDANDAVKLSKVALDYAAASGKDYRQTLDMLSQSIESGNPRALRQLGITANVAKVFENYAASLGKTANNLTDVEKRQAVLNAVLENSKRVAGSWESTMGTGGGAAVRFGQETEKLKDTIGGYFTPVVTVATEELTKMAAAMNKMGVSADDQKSRTDRIRDWFRWMGVGFKEAGDGIVLFQNKLLNNSPWSVFLPRAREVPFIVDQTGKAFGQSGEQAAAATPKLKVYVETLDVMIERIRKHHATQADFEKDFDISLKSTLEGYELQNVKLDDQIVRLKKIRDTYKLTNEERLKIEKQIADLKLKEDKAELDAMKKIRDQMISMFASTVASQIDLFGHGTKSMAEAFEDMINKMVQMLVESMILNFIGMVLSGGGVTLAGLFTGGSKGFDNPVNDMRAQMAGGKWFSDALENFSKGYVNQALKMEQTGPVFAAAASGGGGNTYHISPSYSPMFSLGTPGEARKAGIVMAGIIKQQIGSIR